MSRLQTFLTYKDYDEFSRTAHCTRASRKALGLREDWAYAYCKAWASGRSNSCGNCIFYQTVPFKAEALLTKKET